MDDVSATAEVRVRVGDALSIGAFTQVFPIKNVKAVLKQTGTKSKRERLLPNHVVVYYVLAMSMMMTASYQEVMRWLLEGSRTITGLKSKVKPLGTSGISQARERLGCEPFKQLYEQFVKPIATTATKGAWYKHWLVVSVDGSSMDVADTPENDQEFGRQISSRGKRKSAFPKVRFVSLIENGSRVLFGMAWGAYAATSERGSRQTFLQTYSAGNSTEDSPVRHFSPGVAGLRFAKPSLTRFWKNVSSPGGIVKITGA